MFTAAVAMSSPCDGAKWPPQGVTVLEPTSPAFANATLRWNGYGAPTFNRAITPTSAAEVAAIVKGAVAANVPFLAMGGRHGYGTTFSQLDDGLAIDLSHLNGVTIDKAAGTVRIEGGAKIRDVLTPVAAAGFQIGSGACNCAGYTGTAIGAGIGYLQGTFGLVTDALVSVDFVTAKGEQIKVSDVSNPDLFWGLRGAGANFGIVTSATYKLSKPVNGGQVFHAELAYGAPQQDAYFKTMEAYQAKMPAKLGFSTALFWDAASNSTSILSTFIYVGTEAEARQSLKPFFDLNPAVIVTENIPFQRVPSVVLNGVTDGACDTTNGVHSIHTVNVRKWPAATFSTVYNKFDAYLRQHEEARVANSAIIIESFSTAAPTSVPDDRTAYPWRDATAYIMLQMRWPGIENPFSEIANNFAKELRSDLVATSGYSGLSAYVNYAWGDETLEQIYRKDKLQRLKTLKKKWDPNNVFRFSNGLPTN